MVSLQGNQARTDIQIQLSLSENTEVEDVTQQVTTLLRNAHDLDNDEDDDDNKDAYITKHFDFRLDGNINGNESSR